VNLAEYQTWLEQIPYGKRLPTALYLFREEKTSFGETLDKLLTSLASTCGADSRHNVIKFRLDELKVSFLSYPEFLDNAHPVLRHAITVDMATGKWRQTDYSCNINPPILHRKEALLSPDHPRRTEFAALTQTEEGEGLYEHTNTIGFKLNWERLLAQKGLALRGHQLCRVVNSTMPSHDQSPVTPIKRYKTAITRYEFSKPVKSLLEYGLLQTANSFFDYGCGQGADVNGLRALGYEANGWDPVYRPECPLVTADIVNLGYVINVIEDPAERLETLCNAHRLARKLLVVSALIQRTVQSSSVSPFSDGLLTRRKTFQKFYDQQELQQFIEDALESTAIPVALGVFYVFRDSTEQQDFISARTRRSIDWDQISSRLGLGQPRARSVRVRIDLYEQYRDLLDEFWSSLLELGRLPSRDEFPRFDELRQAVRSPKRAEKLFLDKGGKEELDKARETRRNDLLVYLAMSNLRKPVPFRCLSRSLKLDIRSHFGNYKEALAQGRELLFAAGDPGQIEVACQDSAYGWHDEQALYIHRSLLDKLPPLLRVYVGCASYLYGDVAQADLIKLHKASGKVTFLVYDRFENIALPELLQRIKVNLRMRSVQVFDHSPSGQLLYFKERFLAADHPGRAKMEKFSARLRRLGIIEQEGFGPTKGDLAILLAAGGLNENLCRKRKPRSTSRQPSVPESPHSSVVI
jgi:DNA phosphorothioation-associated putative methyltransferase